MWKDVDCQNVRMELKLIVSFEQLIQETQTTISMELIDHIDCYSKMKRYKTNSNILLSLRSFTVSKANDA